MSADRRHNGVTVTPQFIQRIPIPAAALIAALEGLRTLVTLDADVLLAWMDEGFTSKVVVTSLARRIAFGEEAVVLAPSPGGMVLDLWTVSHRGDEGVGGKAGIVFPAE